MRSKMTATVVDHSHHWRRSRCRRCECISSGRGGVPSGGPKSHVSHLVGQIACNKKYKASITNSIRMFRKRATSVTCPYYPCDKA